MTLQKKSAPYILVLLIIFLVIPINGSKKKPYQCSSCKKKFSVRALASRCSFADNNKQKIKLYIKSNDQTEEIKEWKCPLQARQEKCTHRPFSTLDQVKQHLQLHATNSQTCPFPKCCMKIKARSSLSNHMLQHTPFRPYKCTYPVCTGYSAVQEINVFSHVVTHLRSTKKIKKHKKRLPTPVSHKTLAKKQKKDCTLTPTPTTQVSLETLFLSVDQGSDPVAPKIQLLEPEEERQLSLFLTVAVSLSESVGKQNLSLPVTPPKSAHCLPTLDIDLFPDPLNIEPVNA